MSTFKSPCIVTCITSRLNHRLWLWRKGSFGSSATSVLPSTLRDPLRIGTHRKSFPKSLYIHTHPGSEPRYGVALRKAPYLPPVDPSNAGAARNFNRTFLDMEPAVKDAEGSGEQMKGMDGPQKMTTLSPQPLNPTVQVSVLRGVPLRDSGNHRPLQGPHRPSAQDHST